MVRSLGCSVLLLSVLGLNGVMVAQLQKGNVGIAKVFDSSTLLTGSYGQSENFRLNIGLGFESEQRDSTTSTYSVNIGGWFYKPAVENVSMFLGGSVEFGGVSKKSSSATSFGLHGVLGAEYWLAPHFSIAGWGQFGFKQLSGPPKISTIATEGVLVSITWWID